MSPGNFKCICCGDHHDKQAFVSHASDDDEIAAKLKHACCENGVAPYLFEFSPESRSQAAPSRCSGESSCGKRLYFRSAWQIGVGGILDSNVDRI